MISRKEIQRSARRLFVACLEENRLVSKKVLTVANELAERKPRGWERIADGFTRLVRLELSKRHAIIDCATELDSTAQEQITKDLKQKNGNDITTEFRLAPDLIGGMRIQLGSDVTDGSVAARIQRLREQFI